MQIGKTVNIISLESGEVVVVNHVEATDQLADSENYVLTGLDTHYFTNHLASHYIQTAPGYEGLKFSSFDIPIRKFSSLYRTYSGLDLEEVKRIKNQFIDNKIKLKSFDT